MHTFDASSAVFLFNNCCVLLECVKRTNERTNDQLVCSHFLFVHYSIYIIIIIMATDPLSMSLDDLVKSNRAAAKKKKQANNKDQQKKKRGGNKNNNDNRNGAGAPSKAKKKKRGASATSRAGRRAAKPYSRDQSSAKGGSKKRRGGAPPASKLPGLTTGTKVVVSNLNRDIAKDDIQELFGEMGPLRSVTMRRGGSAEVIFRRRKDAETAIAEYNGRGLDGRPMKIRIVEKSAGVGAAPSKGKKDVLFKVTLGGSKGKNGKARRRTASEFYADPGGNTLSKEMKARTATSNKRKGRGHKKKNDSGSSRREKPAPANAANLDKEMETYFASNKE